MEHRTPLFLRSQIEKVLGIEESRVVGAIVGPSRLADHFANFRELRKSNPRLVHDVNSFCWSSAGGECPTRPDCPLVEMWQELGADSSREQECPNQNQRRHANG